MAAAGEEAVGLGSRVGPPQGYFLDIKTGSDALTCAVTRRS